MNNVLATQLWLATIYVHTPQDDDVEGVLAQRLIVAELDNEALVVRRKVRQFAKAWYGPNARIEAITPVPSVSSLPSMLMGVDLIKKSQFDGLEPCHTPASVILEMGYDDYSPYDQSTPSRIESLLYPNRELAEAAAQHALRYINEKYSNYRSFWTTRIEVSEINSGQAVTAEAVEVLIDEMMENYLDDKEDEEAS